MNIDIDLNEDEMARAERTAHLRQDEAVKAGRPDRHGYDGKDGYKIHLLGCAGELAFCKALGVPWPASVNTFQQPDLILRCDLGDLEAAERASTPELCRLLGLICGAMSVNTSQTDYQIPCQIKTRSEHWYDLMVRPNGKNDEVFIHVTGEPPHMVIRGWMIGRDAKQPQWMKYYGDRPGAWFVPENALNRLD